MPAPLHIRDASIQLHVLSVNNRVLQGNIASISAASGRTVKEETRRILKSIVRDALAPMSAASQAVRERPRNARAWRRSGVIHQTFSIVTGLSL